MIRTIIILLLPALAFAGGRNSDEVDVDVSNTVNVGGDTVNVGGDTVNVGGPTVNTEVGPTTVNAGDVALNSDSKSFAFAHGLGDVDIAQCLGSEQWGTVIISRQYLELNKWCAAEVYDAKGLYKMAAVLRCDIKEIKKHFNSPEECVEANTLHPVIVTQAPEEPEVIVIEPPEELQEAHVEQQMALETIEQKVAALEVKQRAAQREIAEKRDLAQRTLRKLENDPED
jgi:hypothetical protein